MTMSICEHFSSNSTSSFFSERNEPIEVVVLVIMEGISDRITEYTS